MLILLTGGSCGMPSIAQSRKPFYSREVSATLDNDIIFFEDYYYTAGQDFTYRRLLRPTSKAYQLFKTRAAADSSKITVEYHYGFKIFTPFDIHDTAAKDMDRPYAGWNFGSVTFSNFPSMHGNNQYQVEMGVVGPMSGMEGLQKWLHRITHYDQPKGWEYQLPNEVVMNASYTRVQNWRLLEEIDIVSQSTVQAGTGSNRVSQEFTLRLAQFNDIGNSVFTNSRLSWDTRKKGLERPFEFFFFGGLGINYVLSNIFIEGSLFPGNKSPVPAHIQPWVFQNKYGLMYSKHDISWSITLYHLSNDMIAGASHAYANFAVAVRF